MRKATVESLTPKVYEQRRQYHKHGDEQIKALQQQFHQFKDSYDDMNFTGPYLSTVTARTLIVHGDRDQFFPVSIAVEMYRSIPNSALWIIPRGGHVPIFDPAIPFTATALKFLAEGLQTLRRECGANLDSPVAVQPGDDPERGVGDVPAAIRLVAAEDDNRVDLVVAALDEFQRIQAASVPALFGVERGRIPRPLFRGFDNRDASLRNPDVRKIDHVQEP
jgi:fermentation-respiration switch protein FrsA (DUF1100 family)